MGTICNMLHVQYILTDDPGSCYIAWIAIHIRKYFNILKFESRIGDRTLNVQY